MKQKEIFTDVLIIGAGGAGLRAAIEAKRRGAEVTLASKMPADALSSSAMAAGWFIRVTDDNRDAMFQYVVQEGCFLNNQRLARIFVDESVHRIPELREFGVNLEITENPQERRCGRPFMQYQSISTSGPHGYGFTRPLRNTAERNGVQFLDNVMVTNLLLSHDGRSVVGAIAVDLARREFLVIAAKSVIIATGGASCIYARCDNPDGTSGDGYALAYRAGAELVDMEFVTFNFPTTALHEIFRVSPQDASAIQLGTCHYFLGGVKIDVGCASSLDGLYTAGEASGGVFGAARLGGSAIAEIIVFGAIAGQNAAERAKRIENSQLDNKQIEQAQQRLEQILHRPNGISPQNLQERIKTAMWHYAGVVRTEETLQRAETELAAVRIDAEQLSISSTEDIRAAIETMNMLDVSEMVVTAAQERTESRGAHWRMDYPHPDDEHWLKNIILYKDDGEMKLKIESPVMTHLIEPQPSHIGTPWSGYLENHPPVWLSGC